MITQNRTIIDGYCRWEIARRYGRPTVTCIEYDLTEEEALYWLLCRHRRVEGLNAFCRILLALDLEPWLSEQARRNQSAGGRIKGASKLTEAEKLDVRSEIAATAGVSVGNVTKVKQVLATAHTELQDALRGGEVRYDAVEHPHLGNGTEDGRRRLPEREGGTGAGGDRRR